MVRDSEVPFLADVIEARQYDELVVEQKFSPIMLQLQSPSRNSRQEHASYLWPLFSHQNNYVFWLTIMFPTVFCLAVCNVLRWPKCMRDIILVVQNSIMHA